MTQISEFFCTSPVCEGGYRPLINNRCGFCGAERTFRADPDDADPAFSALCDEQLPDWPRARTEDVETGGRL